MSSSDREAPCNEVVTVCDQSTDLPASPQVRMRLRNWDRSVGRSVGHASEPEAVAHVQSAQLVFGLAVLHQGGASGDSRLLGGAILPFRLQKKVGNPTLFFLCRVLLPPVTQVTV